jgi:hypothetical protein
MDADDSVPFLKSLSIRFVLNPLIGTGWGVAVRNESLEMVAGLTLRVACAGICTPGDLGGTIIPSFDIDRLFPFEERRFGGSGFIRGATYRGDPFAMRLWSGDRLLMMLDVTTDDFDRLEELRGTKPPPD